MSDVKELFDMVTKQTEPDLDSWKEQEDRQRRTARNRRNGALAVAAAIVLVTAFAVATLRQGDEPLPPMGNPTDSSVVMPPITHQYVNITTGERSPVLADMGGVVGARLPEVSPNGQRIVFGTCCSLDNLYVAGLDGSERVTITPTDLDGYAATWVDDERILFQGRFPGTMEIGDLYIADVATGDITMVTDLPDQTNGSWIIESDLSPDGTTVLFHLPRGKAENAEWDLWTAPLDGGEPTLLREDAGFAQYGPDGSIVFLDHPAMFESEEIWIMDGDGSDARRLVRGVANTAYSWPRFSPDGTKIVYRNEKDGTAEVIDLAGGDEVDPVALEEDTEPAWYGNDMLIVDETSAG